MALDFASVSAVSFISTVVGRNDTFSDGGDKLNNDKTFVAYYRVSTQEQGRSGLGEDAQRQAVARFINGNGSKLVAEFREVESGRNNERPKLGEAIRRTRAHGARLVVAKLDRLSRDAAFILGRLRDEEVDFICAACRQPIG